MDPKNISIADYTYELSEERIAKLPAPERDSSKLLIYQNDLIKEDIYKNIAAHLPENALLIFNNTKVVEARILFQKPSGGQIEIFCLEPAGTIDISSAMMAQQKTQWKCLVGGASKWKHGQILEKRIPKKEGTVILRAAIVQKEAGHFIIEFSWEPAMLSFAELLHIAGLIPLPPYLNREAEPTDVSRYQTIYAKYDGSVAAPTAGLHFTPYIFSQLDQKKIKRNHITLHVGAGTFKPVKTETISTHEMHAELITVGIDTIENILYHLDNPIIAVGTTSARTIESLYWLGVKTISTPDINSDQLLIHQWDPYETTVQKINTIEALLSLLEWMKKNQLKQISTKTALLIVPGYEYKIINGLITNFHQPQSTLLLLVAALIGEGWKQVYRHALQNDFRFLSYGDGCLLFKK
ncbi:MAG: S-adenosylmethionine:tRNA ribosyltransferase-isomerase [Bacteroidetes bacterium]|nr:S-adenosylmethionine:tRNA ribosyltransferase-isomerase [Bacteroidota bacterium]